MIVIGIDPGIDGGIVAFQKGKNESKIQSSEEYNILSSGKLPVTEDSNNQKKIVDPTALYIILKTISNHNNNKCEWPQEELFIYVEQEHAQPRKNKKGESIPFQNISSIFNFGRTFGAILAVAELVVGIDKVRQVHPTVWKRDLKLTKDKATSIAWCKENMPQLNLLATNRSRTPHDGIAEAGAIAWWGWNKEWEIKIMKEFKESE